MQQSVYLGLFMVAKIFLFAQYKNILLFPLCKKKANLLEYMYLLKYGQGEL